MKIYNKEIIAKLELNLFRRDYKVIVLDNKEKNMYDIHIIANHYQKDELDTLILQEPKDAISVEELDKLHLTIIAMEFVLWDELYGYKDKSYSFSIKVTDECEL